MRSLHMTGPSTYASPLLTRERPVLNQLPRDVAGLRAECKRRNLEATGSKQELIARLSTHELISSRAFSSAVEQSKRPTAESGEVAAAPTQTVRHFNTSRSLKAVNDSSTIDFAYLPAIEPDDGQAADFLRVPIVPDNYNPPRTGAHAPEAETVVMKPQISTMSADAVFLPMSDMSDGNALNIDFHAMADRVSANLRRMKVPVEEQAGLMKQLWNDIVDDMVGASKRATGH